MTDISIIRSDFYVYVLFREDGVTPFYIGKGRGTRIDQHEKEAVRGPYLKDRVIRKMWRSGCKVIPKAKLAEGLTDGMAKQIERDLIQLIGRMSAGGPLANLTRGGDGVGGLTPESLARKIAANKLTWSDPIVRQRRLDGIKAAWTLEKRATHAEMKNAQLTPELRKKIRDARIAANERPEVRAAMAAAARRPETLAAKSVAAKKRYEDPAYKERHAAASRLAQSDPAYRARRKIIADAIWERPGMKEGAAERMRERQRANPTPPEAALALNTPAAIAKRAATNRIPEVREKRIAAQRAAFSTPEAKAIRSAASKKLWAERRNEIVAKRRKH